MGKRKRKKKRERNRGSKRASERASERAQKCVCGRDKKNKREGCMFKMISHVALSLCEKK